MRRIYMPMLSVFLILLSISCSKDEERVLLPDNINPYKTGKDLSLSQETALTPQAKGESLFVLGYGYDATGKYAHPTSIKNKVLDIEKYGQENPGRLLFNKVNSLGPGLLFGGTRSEIKKTMAHRSGFSDAETAKYDNLFHHALVDEFNNDTTFPNLNYSFYTSSEVLTSYLLRFDYSTNKQQWFLNNYLSAQFLQDIDSKSADEILRIYGTHVLRSVGIGQRIDYIYRYAEDKKSSAEQWFIYSMRSYFNGIGLVQNYKPETEAPLKENLYVEVIDGSKSTLNSWMIDITNYTKGRVPSNSWGKSIDDNLTLVDFWGKEESLIPIYEFVQDDVKKAALTTAFDKYLGTR